MALAQQVDLGRESAVLLFGLSDLSKREVLLLTAEFAGVGCLCLAIDFFFKPIKLMLFFSELDLILAFEEPIDLRYFLELSRDEAA